MTRWGVTPLLGALVLALPATGWAQSTSDAKKEACADAYDNAQVLRDEGRLELARAQLNICSSACPDQLANDCRQWLAEVEARMPSVALSAQSDTGDAVEVLVSIDGAPARALPAGELPLAVGEHRFRFERVSDGAAVELRADLSAGERGHAVVARFDGATQPMAASDIAVIALAVAGGAAVVVAGALAIKGHVDRRALFDCRPDCAQGDVDAVARTWNISGAVAGVGAGLLGAALLVWLLADDAGTEASAVGYGAGGLTVRF